MTKKKTVPQKKKTTEDILIRDQALKIEPKKEEVKKVEPKTELTELEKFWVEQKCKDGVSLEEVKSADIQPVSLVESYYNQVSKEFNSVSSDIKASNLFGRNEKYGAVVMTQTASELGDAKKKIAAQSGSQSGKKQNHIHKFRNR